MVTIVLQRLPTEKGREGREGIKEFVKTVKIVSEEHATEVMQLMEYDILTDTWVEREVENVVDSIESVAEGR